MSSSWSALHVQLLRATERLFFQQHFDHLRRRQAGLACFPDPAALLDHQRSGDAPTSVRHGVIAALVRETSATTPQTEAAVILALLALWPGLDAIYHRLLRDFRSEPDRLAADILGQASLGLRTLDLDVVLHPAATLIRNVERDLVRELRTEHRQIVTDPADVVAAADLAQASDPHRVERAVEDLLDDLHRLVGVDAALVISVAVEGLSQREAAGRLGLTHDAARKRYQRTLARLRQEFR